MVVFSGQQWRQWFDKYRQEKDKKGMGSLRSAVMTQTFNAFRKMSYTCPNGDTITLNEDRVLAGLRGGTASVMVLLFHHVPLMRKQIDYLYIC